MHAQTATRAGEVRDLPISMPTQWRPRHRTTMMRGGERYRTFSAAYPERVPSMNATMPASSPGHRNARLAGQTAIVTGASSGIGESVARELAAAGAAVVVNYSSSPEEADRIVGEITRNGARAIAVKADVSQEEEVRALFAETVEQFGTVDIVVSNAGIQKDAAFVDMTVEQWQKVIDVNLTGAFLCAREGTREFLRRGPRPDVSMATGKIIFTSSVHELIPWAGHVNYAASKGGLLLFMKSIAQELVPKR